jgi:hypothetical protein
VSLLFTPALETERRASQPTAVPVRHISEPCISRRAVLTLQPFRGAADQYRLCPLSSALTEECFQQRPLPFAGKLQLEWQNGSRLEIEGRYLSAGTTPLGSTWSRNPMPYAHPNKEPEFAPPCVEHPDAWKTETGVCSGRYLTNVSVVDSLIVPKDTPAGDYVMQLRYDCEETAQICERQSLLAVECAL